MDDGVDQREEDHIVSCLRVAFNLSLIIDNADRESLKEVINLLICVAKRSTFSMMAECEELADSVNDAHKSTLVYDEFSGATIVSSLRHCLIML